MSRFKKETTAPAESGAVREKSGNGWLRSHWCALALCVTVIIAFALRTVFAYGISADGGFALSGGSSAQYHLHMIESILNGGFSLTDTGVNYPVGGENVYPPLMDFIGAAIATILTATGMGVTEAASASLAVLNPIIGALTCIPVYLVAKEMFDKRVGVVAALIFAFLALPISTTVFSSGTEYGLAAFLLAFMSWFAVKMVKAADAEGDSKKSLMLNAALAGIFLALAALTWNGFRIAVILLVVAMVAQIAVDRVRGREFQGILFGYIVAVLVGTLIPAAYYIPAGLWESVYSGSLLIALIAVVLSLVFMAVRTKPWVITIPALVVVFIAIAAVLALAAPDLYSDLIHGNSIYTNSIMEQLASSYVSMSNVSAYYGWLTMWLPVCFALYSTYVYVRRDRSATRLFTTVWMYVLFFAVWTSYANAAVVGIVFAVGSAVVIVRVLEAANIREWAHNMRIAGFPGLFRKMIKPLPFASVLIVALLVVVPNVSYAVDAGISNNSDADYYFSGNTQYTIKTGDSYPLGDMWENYEDQPKDGALATWIDYSYDSVAQGGFSSVTDTVGGGSSAVAQMLLAEGTGGTVAAMLMRIVMSYDIDGFRSCFSDAQVYETIRGYIQDPSSAKDEINANPSVYGNVRTDITDENAVYLASVNRILTSMDETEIMDAYDSVCGVTGKKISYFLVDSSMLPLQYGDGSSFSTIAYFADYSVDRYGAATQYYSYNTYYGYTVYTAEMYDTFLWRAMIGPSATEAGYSSSYSYLVALSSSDGSADSAKAMPGYGLAGFEVDYWYVMYNPDSEATVSTDGWEYMDAYEAIDKQKTEGGSINYLSSIVMLKYTGAFEGAGTYEGSVVYGGEGVTGATVSVYQYSDIYGQYTLYSQTSTRGGDYTAIVPSGDYRVEISIGDVVLGTYTSSSISQVTVLESTSVSGSITVGDAVYDQESLRLQLSSDAAEYTYTTDDGTIEIDSILPGQYSYTLYSESGSSIGTGSVTVYPGDNVGFEVSPTTRTITVTVNDIYSHAVAGGIVVATNTTTGAQFSAEVEDGKAVISVVSGTYNLSVGQGYVSIHTSTSNVSSSNRTATVTAYEARTVTVSNAVAGELYNVSCGFFSTVTYELDGAVMFDVPVGLATDEMLYTVYGIGTNQVYHASYTGDGDAVSLQSGAAYTISGTLKNGSSGASGTVQFISASDEVYTVSTDSDGNYTAVLPAGTYTVSANNGSNMAYIGSYTVDGDSDEEDIALENGRRISYTFRYDRGTSQSDAYLPFVLGMITFTYEEVEYTLYGMTNTSGVVNFYIPDNVASSVSLNNAEGTLDNDSFACSNLVKSVSSGTSNSSQRTTIPVFNPEKEGDDAQENYVKPQSVTADYDMTLVYYEDSDNEIEMSAGQTMELRPGSYTVTIDGATGHYFNGTLYLYPGETSFYGLDGVEEVATVNVTDGDGDMVSVTTADGSYHRFDGGYYMEVGYIYTLTSTNTGDDGERKVAYGYLDLTDASAGTYSIDMTAQDAIQVTGNVGVVADGTITVTYRDGSMTVVREFEVADGAYTLLLPADVTTIDVDAEVSTTISSETCYFGATGTFAGLEDGDVRNIAVLSTDAPESEEEPAFTADVTGETFRNGDFSAVVTIKNNTDGAKTYLVTAGNDLSLDMAYSVNVPANGEASVNVSGAYDANRVAPGSSGMTLTVADINGDHSETFDLTDGGDSSAAYDVEILQATSEDDRAAGDRISAYQYLYAITIVNDNTYTHAVTVSVSGVSGGWAVAIVDESGKVIAEPGHEFSAYGLQTTVLYVKLMLLEPTDEAVAVPGITAVVSVDGGHSQSLSLRAQSVEVSTDDMGVSGDNVFDERSGIPSGVWFLVAVILLLLVATFWLASKRGVFSRRN